MIDHRRMHEEQFRVHNHEIDELSKRNSALHEQNVRLDIEFGRVADELQVTLGRMEQLRNECANLRAEKKIWEVGFYDSFLSVMLNIFEECSRPLGRREPLVGDGTLSSC